MKLSFSLPSSKASARPIRRDAAAASVTDDDQAAAPSSARPEFVTVFDPTLTLAADAAPALSIDPLPNTDTWRAPKRMKNLLPPPSDPHDTSSSSDVATRFELDTSQPDTAGCDSYGLTLRSKHGGDEGEVAKGQDGGRSEPGGVSAELKFREDIERLPEDRGMDEFQDISVEDFSRALLAGYGWKDGKGIGRNAKEDTKVREYRRWDGNGGLGFKPDVAVDKGWKKRRNELPPVPPQASSARRSGSESSTANGKRNEVVRIVGGEHASSKAVFLRRSSKGKGMVVVSLARSGLEVRVGEDMIAELGSAEEENYLRKLKEVEIQEGGRRKDERKRENGDDKRKHKNSSSRSEDGKSSNSVEKRESDERHQFVSDREGEQVSWLRSHIRVRIVSKNFRDGRLYLKKGEVMDVVGPMTCDLSMDESGELLQGVDQEILETALPRRGGPVLVLFGRYTGRFGNLMEKDTEKGTAVVQDADSHELIKVRLEQIAEYVGDPSDLGY